MNAVYFRPRIDVKEYQGTHGVSTICARSIAPFISCDNYRQVETLALWVPSPEVACSSEGWGIPTSIGSPDNLSIPAVDLEKWGAVDFAARWAI